MSFWEKIPLINRLINRRTGSGPISPEGTNSTIIPGQPIEAQPGPIPVNTTETNLSGVQTEKSVLLPPVTPEATIPQSPTQVEAPNATQVQKPEGAVTAPLSEATNEKPPTI